METSHLTVMFTDVEGFTSMTSGHSRDQMLQFIQFHENIITSICQEFRGKIVKNLGDGYLIVFVSPTDAVLCAQRILSAIEANNAEFPTQAFKMRIALHCGEVATMNNDVYGETVNLAARIASMVPAGEVYVSQAVYFAANKNEIAVEKVGQKQFKGIPEKIDIFKLLKEPEKVKNFQILRSLQIRAAALLSKQGGEAQDNRSKEKSYHPSLVRRNVPLFLVSIALFLFFGRIYQKETVPYFSSRTDVKGMVNWQKDTSLSGNKDDGSLINVMIVGSTVSATPKPLVKTQTVTPTPSLTPQPTPTPTRTRIYKNSQQKDTQD